MNQIDRSKGSATLVGTFSENQFFAAGLCSVIDSFEGFEAYRMNESAVIRPDCSVIVVDLNTRLHTDSEYYSGHFFQQPDVKVLVLSCADHIYNEVRSQHLGASGHLSRNCDPGTLHRALLSIRFTGSFFPLLHQHSGPQHAGSYLISQAEISMLRLFCTEQTEEEISRSSGFSAAIVAGYRQVLFDKLRVSSREALILTAYRIGLLPPLRNNAEQKI